MPLDEGGEESRLPLLLVLLSVLPTLFSESLLARRIQLLSVGERESFSIDPADPRLRDGGSTSRVVNSWSARGRRDEDDRVDDEEVYRVADEDAVERCVLLLVGGVGAEVLGFTPFSRRWSGQGF